MILSQLHHGESFRFKRCFCFILGNLSYHWRQLYELTPHKKKQTAWAIECSSVASEPPLTVNKPLKEWDSVTPPIYCRQGRLYNHHHRWLPWMVNTFFLLTSVSSLITNIYGLSLHWLQHPLLSVGWFQLGTASSRTTGFQEQMSILFSAANCTSTVPPQRFHFIWMTNKPT